MSYPPGDQPSAPDQDGQPPSGYGHGPPMPFRGPPDHPRATTALVLGIVAVVGGLLCFFPFFLAPFAWVMGGRAVREIDQAQGQLGGRGAAQAGYVLGIIGSVLLGLALLFLVAFVFFLVITAATSSSTGPGNIPALLGA